MNKAQKELYNLPHRRIDQWDEEYESIYFFHIRKLHDSGYRYIVVVDDKKQKIIGYGDVISFDFKDDASRIDCDKNGIFHFWNWNYKIKITGCSSISIRLGNKRDRR